MQIRMMAVCCLLGVGSLALPAQMGGAAKEAVPGAIATPAEAFDSQLSGIESEMMSAVKAMPADKFDFAPEPGDFCAGAEDGVRHSAHFCAAGDARGRGELLFLQHRERAEAGCRSARTILKLTKKDDVVAALAGSFAFAHKAIATLTPANSFEVIKSPEPGFQTRATLASFGVSHAFDHYGQMVEYLRMNGIVPPASAK